MVKILIRFLGVSAAVVLAVSCGLSRNNQTDRRLDWIESRLNEHPDSALAAVRDLPPAVFRSRAQRARAALLHTIALDKCYIDLQTDSIISPAITYYTSNGTPDEKLKTLYYQGRIQYNAANYRAAIVTYTEALELSNKAKDLKYVGFVNQAIADTYGVTNLEKEALPYLSKAHECFEKSNHKYLANRTLFKMANTFATVDMNQQADSLFRHLLTLDLDKDLRWRVLSDYGLFLTTSGDTSRALKILDQALEEFSALVNLNQWGAYAYVLAKEGKQVTSDSIMAQLEEAYPKDPLVIYWNGKIAEHRKDYKTAFTSLSQSLLVQDSLLRSSLNQSALKAQKEYFQNKEHTTRIELKNQRLRSLLYASLILILLAALVLALWLRIKAYQTQANHYLNLLDELGQRVEELQDSREQLFQAYLYVYGQLSEEYERTKEEGRLDRASFRKLQQVIRNLKGDGKDSFEAIINQSMDHLMADFRRDYGSVLKEEDILLSSYLFAGFDTTTITALLGISPEAYYMRKSRIKKTLNASHTTNKAKYLHFFERKH